MPQLGQRHIRNIEDQIAARAYEKWKQRGCPQGDSSRDWFAASEEVRAEQERRAYEQVIALFD
jgi:hypothetical protein